MLHLIPLTSPFADKFVAHFKSTVVFRGKIYQQRRSCFRNQSRLTPHCHLSSVFHCHYFSHISDHDGALQSTFEDLWHGRLHNAFVFFSHLGLMDVSGRLDAATLRQ